MSHFYMSHEMLHVVCMCSRYVTLILGNTYKLHTLDSGVEHSQEMLNSLYINVHTFFTRCGWLTCIIALIQFTTLIWMNLPSCLKDF
jgi:hypothetical protein